MLGNAVVTLAKLVPALRSVAVADPLGGFLHLGTWGSGSPDRRAKEVLRDLPGTPTNPWTGRPFSKEVLLTGTLGKASFHAADPLLAEYIDLFWAVVFPYEWLRAEALQHFYEAYLPPRMFNSLRAQIRNNALKNAEGPAMRAWVIDQLTSSSDLIALVNVGIDTTTVDVDLARHVRASLPAFRASQQYRDTELDLVEARLPGPQPIAPEASQVRPELLDELDDYLDGPQLPDDPVRRPLSEWGPRFQQVAAGALRGQYGATLSGVAQVAEDAWQAAMVHAATTTPREQWAADECERDQPWVTFESLTAHGALWRAINEALPDERWLLERSREGGRDTALERQAPAGRDGRRADDLWTRRAPEPIDLATLAESEDPVPERGGVRETANALVLGEMLAHPERFTARAPSPSGNPRNTLLRLIRRAADDLRRSGHLRGRINAHAICGLLELRMRRTDERRPDDDAGDDAPIAVRNARYVCDQGHQVTVPFAEGVEAPPTWDCRRCGGKARWVPDNA